MTGVPPEPVTPVCFRHPGREAHIRCQRCSRPICPACMNDASVGFQCPECLAEGRRTTRQAAGPYGGARTGNAATTTFTLIGINVAVWLTVVLSGGQSSSVLARLSLIPQGICEADQAGRYYPNATSEHLCAGLAGGHWIPGIADGAYYQLVTSMFLHEQIWHIATNMFSLYILGPQLERVLGRTRFLALYLVSGLAGSVLGFLAQDPHTSGLGASGAIFGLLGAFVVIIHKVGGDLRQILALVVLNAVITVAVPNISWQAHLGGFIGGCLVAAALVYAPRERRTPVQASAIGGVLVLLVVAVVLRTMTLT